jgi:hypothetical protein
MVQGGRECRCEKERKSWVVPVISRGWELPRLSTRATTYDRCKLHRWKTVSRSSFEYASNTAQLVTDIFRNVARTRFRDSARRVQKNHFGRRRLGILSRGLVNGTHATEEETASGISSILLEHAQREISRPSRSSPVQQTEARRAFTHDPPSSTGPSTSGSNVARPNLRFTRTLDYGSCESPWLLSSS